MGLFDFLSGSGDEAKVIEPFKGAKKYRGDLADAAKSKGLQRINLAGTPYPGQLSAGLSEYESTGLEQLGQYLSSPSPASSNLAGLGRQELEKTLSGEEYDPIEGEYYQAYRENLMRELAEAKDRLASRTSARDQFYSGGRVAGEGELEETAAGGLRQELGRLFETERARRLGAVPMATDFLQFEEQAPLTRIAASQQFGALPREIEQQGLDRDQIEWIRQLTDLGLSLDVALGLSTFKPQVAVEGGTQGMGGDLAKAGATLGAAAIAASDRRIKEHIEPITNSLDKVKELQGFTYNFITKQDRDGGIMAQDLEKVLPEAVVEIGGTKHIKLDAVIGLLVNAINELSNNKAGV